MFRVKIKGDHETLVRKDSQQCDLKSTNKYTNIRNDLIFEVFPSLTQHKRMVNMDRYLYTRLYVSHFHQ